jgi:hypothetical protein
MNSMETVWSECDGGVNSPPLMPDMSSPPHPPHTLMKRLLLVALAAFMAAPAGAQHLTFVQTDDAEVAVGRRCAAVEHDAAVGAEAAASIAQWLREHHGATSGVMAVNIPVAFHIVHRTNNEGNIPDSRLDAQVNVLNAAYAGSGFSFYRASVDRRANNSWNSSTPGSSAERTMKQTLARNVATTLNFYVTKPGQSLLGWATFPWDYAQTDYRHGVVVHYNTLPGGTMAPYNLGDTGTHEVGHYLGLYHTFQGGCSATAGDYVSDTAPEASPAYGCPSGRDSCPTLTGVDPITNFMDYSDDACMYLFSGGQRSRMTAAVAQYKPSLGTGFAPGTVANSAAAPTALAVEASPNPFAASATLRYTVATPGEVSVRVYDALGREVAVLFDGVREAGAFEAHLDAAALAPGTYVARVVAGVEVAVVRLTHAR